MARRSGGGGRFLLRNGRGATLGPGQSLADSPFLATGELGGGGAESRIFLAAPLQPEEVRDLFADEIHREEQVVWDDAAGAVQARRRERLGAIVLRDGALHEPDPEAVASALLDGVRRRGLSVLAWPREARQMQERIVFARNLEGEEWPDVSDAGLAATLEDWLLPHLGGMRTADHLARVDPGTALAAWLGWVRQRRLDEIAPTHVQVPSGSRIAIDYGDADAPVLAVRLQEVFGWTETPRIGGGRVALTLHLLSPAQRPVQVTRDLASFWRSGYFEVRKDLRGRYPKHYWPDDPTVAEATRRARPR